MTTTITLFAYDEPVGTVTTHTTPGDVAIEVTRIAMGQSVADIVKQAGQITRPYLVLANGCDYATLNKAVSAHIRASSSRCNAQAMALQRLLSVARLLSDTFAPAGSPPRHAPYAGKLDGNELAAAFGALRDAVAEMDATR